MGSAAKRIQYRYDARGNRQSTIDPDGGRFTYSYDARNRIQHLVNPQGERTTYSYDSRNRRTETRLANGTRTSYSYDSVSNLERLSNLKSDGTVISDFQYSYDRTGNRTSVLEGDGRRVTWSYDAASQLICEHRPAESWNDLSLDDWDTLSPEGWGALSVDSSLRSTYTYDPAGNRTLKNEGGARTTYSYDAANQLKWSQDTSGRTTYTFDADGNQQRVLAPDGSQTTTVWDYENRTTSVQLPSGIRNTMAYESEGLRVKLDESAGTKKFVWDDQNYLVETDALNDTQVVYTNEPRYYGNLISQRRGSTTSWYHFDALGSTRQLTDATQAITDQRRYDAWGTVIESGGSTVFPFRYVGSGGYYAGGDEGSIYIRGRYYKSIAARWKSVDIVSGRTLANLYTYCYNNPVFLVDTNGWEPTEPPPPFQDHLLTFRHPTRCGVSLRPHSSDGPLFAKALDDEMCYGPSGPLTGYQARSYEDILAPVQRYSCCDLFLIGHRGNGRYAGGSYLNPGGIIANDRLILPNDEFEASLRDAFKRNGCRQCRITMLACGNYNEKTAELAGQTASLISFNTGCTVCYSVEELWFGDIDMKVGGIHTCVIGDPKPVTRNIGGDWETFMQRPPRLRCVTPPSTKPKTPGGPNIRRPPTPFPPPLFGPLTPSAPSRPGQPTIY